MGYRLPVEITAEGDHLVFIAEVQDGQPPAFHLLMGATSLEVGLQPDEERRVIAVLAREIDQDSARARWFASAPVIGWPAAG